MGEEMDERSMELQPHTSAVQPGNMDAKEEATEGPGHTGQTAGSPSVPQGSPQYSVDETSLQQQRDKNKMSLKVKLMQRRPVNQLVDQGIMPPPKTPQAHFEQRRHLERARTGDILKTKIEKRPDRQALVQQHILEDTKIAPSLHERQRKLKRAKLADYLNDKIAHRPGPLELVQGNILKLPTVPSNRDGSRKTSTTSTDGGNGHSEASSSGLGGEPACSAGNETEYSTEEDVSSTASSPTGALSNLKDLQVASPASVGTSASTSLESIVPSPASSVSSLPGQAAQGTSQASDRRRANSLVQVDSSSASAASPAAQGYPGTSSLAASSSLPPSQGPSSSSSASSLRRSKKCRLKMPVLQKTRTIKFHEYKGPTVTPSKNNTSQVPPQSKNNPGEQVTLVPPSLPATTDNNPSPHSTSYENNLRQQQMFLKMQLESQYRAERRQARLIQAINNQANSNTNDTTQSATNSTDPPKPSPTVTHMTLTFPAQTQSQAATSCNVTLGSLTSVVPSSPVLRPVVTSSIPPPPPVPLVVHTTLVPPPAPKKTEEVSLKVEVKTEEKPAFKPEDMKVNDLKVELKKRNLPVSGSKTHLLERLRNYLNANPDDKFTFEPKKSPATSTAESPVEVKSENDVAFSSSSSEIASSGSSTEAETCKEAQAAPQPQLSFLQLDPLQQQQATAIALQTLALAAKGVHQNGTVPHIQNLHIQMDVDPQHQQPPRSVAQPTVLNALPTIFLTTQPTTATNGTVQGLTFQSTPIQTNSMPYIITMNGLNSTLNLVNGFNGSLNGLVQVSSNENLSKPPPVPRSPPAQNADSPQTSMQKLQQFLQQKMKHEDKSNGFSDGSNSPSFSLQQQPSQMNHGMTNGSGLDSSMMMDEDTNMSGYQNTYQQLQQQSNVEEDGSITMNEVKKEEVNVSPANYTHRSSFSLAIGGGVKSEAIDDVLEILIRNGELPASAAQDAIPKSEILQHNKPLPSISSGAFHERRLYNHSLSSSPYQPDEPMPQNPSPSTSSRHNSSCGPLPPISSISPSANHGSPVSCLNSSGDTNDTLSLQSQLAMYNDYLNQSQTITTSPISLADSHEMDQDHNMWNNPSQQMDYSQTMPNTNNNHLWTEQMTQNNDMTDADLSNWLDNLMQNNTFGQDVMPALGNDSFQQCFAPNEQDGFHLRNNGQNGFPQPDLYQNMDVSDTFFSAASQLDPHMFEMLLDDFHESSGMTGANGGNGGFLPSFASLNGQNGSSYLYCSEPEQML